MRIKAPRWIGCAVATALLLGVPVTAQDSRARRASGESGETYVQLASKAVPSVVNISTLSTVQGPVPGSPEDFFRRFFGEQFGEEGGMPFPAPPDGPMRATALGTGFVVEASAGTALILTNNHVVQGADEIQIRFTESAGETPTEGEVVGRDPELDIALIRVKAERGLRPLPLGDSDALQVGEEVGAIGNPFGQGHSITHGIISAKGRPSPDFPLLSYLQTDAPINPGNSGGPLLNMEGEVIGVNNAILAQAQGIGFAIPINLVKAVLPQLKTEGTVTRGYIGVLVGETTPDIAAKLGVKPGESSPFITHVYEGSPAAQAGIRPYDVIQRFNGKEIESSADLIREVIEVPVGRSVPVEVDRNGQRRNLNVRIAQRPSFEEEQVQQSGQTMPQRQEGGTGLSVQKLTPDLARKLNLPTSVRGVVVAEVSGNSPGEKAGLSRGDVILEVDRKTVPDVDEFRRVVKSKGSYLLRVRRPTPEGDTSVFVAMLEIP